jgi:hypothetical protein
VLNLLKSLKGWLNLERFVQILNTWLKLLFHLGTLYKSAPQRFLVRSSLRSLKWCIFLEWQRPTFSSNKNFDDAQAQSGVNLANTVSLLQLFASALNHQFVCSQECPFHKPQCMAALGKFNCEGFCLDWAQSRR